MFSKIGIENFLKKREEGVPLIDVRSPGEFVDGHIPGAVNIPLFSNNERHLVGIEYKQKNRQAALLKGLEFIGPKMVSFLKQAIRLEKNKELLIHCWRGGMRSESMAWLFSINNYTVYVLEGGYKNYRNHVLSLFSQKANILILSGKTGSGKTDLLPYLKQLGEQTIDLEGLANHKGSAFGALGQQEQPSTQQFENLLFDEWQKLDRSKRIWLEDESASIGKISIPSNVFHQMRAAQVVELQVPDVHRIDRLEKDYASFSKEELIASTKKITKRLGNNIEKEIEEDILSGNMRNAIRKTLFYYDKAYEKGLSKRIPESIFRFKTETSNFNELAASLINFANKLSSG